MLLFLGYEILLSHYENRKHLEYQIVNDRDKMVHKYN
jgi:hypothetical protein